ncbi:YceI family protein [Paenibacillus protaetiae]|uniref:Polyisoprenoid-binding protein n=1 Tax=Paenibacillus protaetiae TaxID=2509456 RepID=A0A4P6FAU7_9BACL|nr:YceI family protein [Paenibacillus protaetiae]QAY67638.1 polyisoprenoid-binding protein [Paenibacillus protaetiae]
MAKTNWVVDAAHSSVDFYVKHMMIAKVKGTFHQFDASIEADLEDLANASIAFNIDLNSVDTRNADRDNHLRSADFFDLDNYPALTFRSTGIVRNSDGEYDLFGDVTLHGVTRSETFALSFEGSGRDPWGNEKAGFSASGVLRRSDYGLSYNAVLETGGVLIGDEVKFTIDVEAAKQA